MSKINGDIFEKALMFAAKKHSGQKRKGNGEPYIMHPLSVVKRIKQYKKDSTNPFLLGTVAVLHDTSEDCGVKIKTIAKKFGHSVAALVEELTLDKEQYKVLGKAEYLARETVNMSSYALAIKLCDRLDNVCDMKGMSQSFITRYKKETHFILERLKTRKKLTKTHKSLIKVIKQKLKNY